jgi:ABC-type amino acid transport substrate-binding protein
MTAAMRIRETSVVVGLVVLAVACAGPVSAPPRRGEPAKELVVATSGDSPPYATRRAGTITGLEVDLAIEVGKVLGRPVRLVDGPWDGLFDELASRRADVVMAGVTVTAERERRFAFAEPYLHTGIGALVRHDDLKRFDSRDAVCKSRIRVAVIRKTTGERNLRKRCPAMIPRVYETADDAVMDLTRHRIKAVVHDAPVLAYLMSQQAAALDLLPTSIADEPLAWMVRRDDTALRQALNDALVTMRRDGTLDRVLEQWIPQVERVRSLSRAAKFTGGSAPPR